MSHGAAGVSDDDAVFESREFMEVPNPRPLQPFPPYPSPSQRAAM